MKRVIGRDDVLVKFGRMKYSNLMKRVEKSIVGRVVSRKKV